MPDWFAGPAGGALALVVAGLATARLTRLIITDQITDPLRRAAWRADPDMRHVGYLVTCPYCVGVWAALIVWVLLSVSVSVAHDSWAGWLTLSPVMIGAIAQAALLLTSRDKPESGTSMLAAAWPEEARHDDD